jgi:hypothetical protein
VNRRSREEAAVQQLLNTWYSQVAAAKIQVDDVYTVRVNDGEGIVVGGFRFDTAIARRVV